MTASADSAMSGSAPAPATGRAAQRVPDFFIVGHPKCGTTALYRMLRAHPQIFMPDVKEPWFLAPELRAPRARRSSASSPRRSSSTSRCSRPRGPSQRVGEASSSYLMSRYGRRRASPSCAAARGSSRSCASPRASCARCICSCCRCTSRPSATCAGRSRSRRSGARAPHPAGSPRPRALLYSEHVRYVEQLRRYHELFARERVLVLIYDDFRADNEATLRRVLRFLDVDELAPIEVVEANPTVARALAPPAPRRAGRAGGERTRLGGGQGLGQAGHLAAAAPRGAARGQAQRGLRRATVARRGADGASCAGGSRPRSWR